MPNQSEIVSQVFYALTDQTRRAVIVRLSSKPATVSDLARPFAMSLPSFTQHLGVLEKCGIVKSHKKGRVRTYRLVPERLAEAEDWLMTQRRLWEKRLDQLDDYLKESE